MRVGRVILVVIWFVPPAVHAQAAGYGPIVVQLPGSARAVGFANAYVGVREPEAVFYNPAQVGGRSGLAVSAERYGSASTAVALAAAFVVGPAGVGLGAQLLDFHAAGTRYPEVAPNGGQLTARTLFPASSAVATLAVSVPFKGIRWGAAAKVAEDQVIGARCVETCDYQARVALADVGAAKDFGPVSVGLAVQNLGKSPAMAATSAALPTKVTAGLAGAGLLIGPFDLAGSLALSVRRGGRVSPAGGVELAYVPIDGVMFAARAGARRPERDAEGPLTLGATFSFDRLSLDYGFEGYAGEGSGHRVGVRVRP